MPKIRYLQNNFTAGEITPYLHGRPDFAAYSNGVKVFDNFIALPHGGAVRRSGFRFSDFAKRVDDLTAREWRLIPFVYSEDEAFILEFGHQYIRFYKNDKTRIDYELASPYAASDLVNLSYAQSANVLYIFNEGYQPRRLIRISDSNWVLNTVEFYDGPYHPIGVYSGETQDVEEWSLDPSDTGTVGGTITINVRDKNDAPITPLNSNDIGRYIRIQHLTFAQDSTDPILTWGIVKITSLNTNAPQINAEVIKSFSAATKSVEWRISAFHGPDKWPKFGVMHEGRLVIAGSLDYPNSFFGSVIDDLTNHSPSDTNGQVNDDNAYNFTIGSNQIDKITWLSSGKALMIGTLGGPYSVTGGDIRIPVGPLAIKATKETSYGAKRMAAVFSDRSHLYASQTGRSLHELFYSYNDDSFLSPSVSIRAEHLLRDGLREVALTQEPYQIIWGATNTDSLVSLTYMRDQNIMAWSRHTGVIVKALAVIPTNDYDQLWVVTVRNGVETVEVLEDLFTGGLEKKYGFFLDGAKQFINPGTTLTVPHLQSKTITALIDGAVEFITTDSNGTFSVPEGTEVVCAGLRYTSRLKMLSPEIVTERGSTLGLLKSIRKMWLDVYYSLGGAVGTEVLEYRLTEDVMDESEPLFTGLLEVPYLNVRDRYPELEIVTDDPFPLHIRNIQVELSVDD